MTIKVVSVISENILKIGDKCEEDVQCTSGTSGPAVCNITLEKCACPQSHPVVDKSKRFCLQSMCSFTLIPTIIFYNSLANHQLYIVVGFVQVECRNTQQRVHVHV